MCLCVYTHSVIHTEITNRMTIVVCSRIRFCWYFISISFFSHWKTWLQAVKAVSFINADLRTQSRTLMAHHCMPAPLWPWGVGFYWLHFHGSHRNLQLLFKVTIQVTVRSSDRCQSQWEGREALKRETKKWSSGALRYSCQPIGSVLYRVQSIEHM